MLTRHVFMQHTPMEGARGGPQNGSSVERSCIDAHVAAHRHDCDGLHRRRRTERNQHRDGVIDPRVCIYHHWPRRGKWMHVCCGQFAQCAKKTPRTEFAEIDRYFVDLYRIKRNAILLRRHLPTGMPRARSNVLPRLCLCAGARAALLCASAPRASPARRARTVVRLVSQSPRGSCTRPGLGWLPLAESPVC